MNIPWTYHYDACDNPSVCRFRYFVVLAISQCDDEAPALPLNSKSNTTTTPKIPLNIQKKKREEDKNTKWMMQIHVYDMVADEKMSTWIDFRPAGYFRTRLVFQPISFENNRLKINNLSFSL